MASEAICLWYITLIFLKYPLQIFSQFLFLIINQDISHFCAYLSHIRNHIACTEPSSTRKAFILNPGSSFAISAHITHCFLAPPPCTVRTTSVNIYRHTPLIISSNWKEMTNILSGDVNHTNRTWTEPIFYSVKKSSAVIEHFNSVVWQTVAENLDELCHFGKSLTGKNIKLQCWPMNWPSNADTETNRNFSACRKES